MSNDSRSPETELTQAEYERRLTEMQKQANITLAQRREAQELLRVYREVVAAACAFVDKVKTDPAGPEVVTLVTAVDKLRQRPDYL